MRYSVQRRAVMGPGGGKACTSLYVDHPAKATTWRAHAQVNPFSESVTDSMLLQCGGSVLHASPLSPSTFCPAAVLHTWLLNVRQTRPLLCVCGASAAVQHRPLLPGHCRSLLDWLPAPRHLVLTRHLHRPFLSAKAKPSPQ